MTEAIVITKVGQHGPDKVKSDAELDVLLSEIWRKVVDGSFVPTTLEQQTMLEAMRVSAEGMQRYAETLADAVWIVSQTQPLLTALDQRMTAIESRLTRSNQLLTEIHTLLTRPAHQPVGGRQ